MIRPATSADITRLVELGVEFINGSRYRSAVKPNTASIGQMMAELIDLPHALLLVSEGPSGVGGMIGMIATMHPMSGEPVMSELFWYVTPDQRGQGLRLLRAAEAWGAGHGIKKSIMISPNKRISKLYRRKGYSMLETQYVKELQ